MATDLRQEAARLEAQQALLTEALDSGLTGEQRRVQRTLLRTTRAELAVAERRLRAAEAGWEPFEPSTEWFWGYVEDPRFLNGRTWLTSVLAALPFVALGGWLLVELWEALPAAAGTLLLLLGLPVALHGILGSIAAEQDKRWRASLGHSEVRIFNAPMPARAAVAYRRARQCALFDSFVVHSPRAEDFRAVAQAEAPSLGLLDPVLAGRIGRHSFLIAQWDLARDLGDAPTVD